MIRPPWLMNRRARTFAVILLCLLSYCSRENRTPLAPTELLWDVGGSLASITSADQSASVSLRRLEPPDEWWPQASESTDEEESGITREDFGNGKLLSSIGTQSSARAVLQLTDGRLVAAGRSLVGSSNNFAFARFHPDGSLDTSFGSNGKINIDLGQGRGELVHAMVQDSNGKLIGAGRYNFGTAPNNYYIWSLVRLTTTGALDTSFASTGFVLTNFNSLNAIPRAISLQTDNRILVAGYGSRQLNTNFTPAKHQNFDVLIARYLTNGAIDSSFSSMGYSYNPVSISSNFDDAALSMTVAATGKIILGGTSAELGVNRALVVRYLTSGVIDSTFAASGRLLLSQGTGSSTLNAIAAQPDGKVVAVGGLVQNTSLDDILVVRIQSDGTLDTSFNGTGVHALDLNSNSFDYGTSLVPLEEGKFAVGGYLAIGSYFDMAVARYLTNGNLDTSGFGTNGRVLTSLGTNHDALFTLTSISGGLVAAGRTVTGAGDRMAVVRYQTDGSIATSGALDRSFGTVGYAVVSFPTSVDALGLGGVLLNDGRILMVGNANDEVGLARLMPTGAIDSGFGASGTVITTVGSDGSEAYRVALQSDNRIVIIGKTKSVKAALLLARYTTSGTLDSSFDGDGILLATTGATENIGRALAIQNDGRIVGGGYSFDSVSLNSSYGFVVFRANTDGSLDTASWGTQGRAFTSINGRDALAHDIAIQADGKVIAAGYVFNGANFDFAAARFSSNGVLDSGSFATASRGRAMSSVFSGDDIGYAMAIMNDGRIVAAGAASNGANYDFGTLRYTTAGTLDSSYDGNGLRIDSLSTGHDIANSIAFQSNGKIIVAGQSYNGTNWDFSWARYLTDGTLDTSLSGNGKVVTSVLGQNDSAGQVLIDQNGKIVLVGRSFQSLYNHFSVMRFWP